MTAKNQRKQLFYRNIFRIVVNAVCFTMCLLVSHMNDRNAAGKVKYAMREDHLTVV